MNQRSPNLKVLRPASIAEALDLGAREPGVRYVAGGTALQLDWRRGLKPPSALISLGDLVTLQGVTPCAAGVRIGAATRFGELERDRELTAAQPLLAAGISRIGAPSVRHLATLGGNVAGRSGCLIPALLALDATLLGQGSAGAWRCSLIDWISRQPSALDIIEAVEVPAMPDDGRWTLRKIGLRAAFTPAVIVVAALLQKVAGKIVAARIAVGGGSVVPARLRRTEGLLLGETLELLDWAAVRASLLSEISTANDDFRSARYRKLAAANALVSGLGGQIPAPLGPRKALSCPPRTALAGEILLSRSSQWARWHIRPDGPAKISGQFRYLTDHRLPGMLVGRILRAGRPHARIVSIDVSRAEALPGVVAVVTHRDVPGQNAFGIVVQDQPALCGDKVRYGGDAVAAVAAIDADIAERALQLIDVVYETLPVVTSACQALSADAPLVHADGNLQRIIEYSRGDAQRGFAACTHCVEETYTTPRQMHGFLETEGGWAQLHADGTLAVHAGGQHAARDRLQLARILDLPEHLVRVVTSPTGGAFGGKDELTVQPALALLALKSGRPVRLQLSRAESVLAGTKRHPMTIRMRTGCTAEGLILAQQVDLLADAGAYASLGPCVLETALEHAAGVYEIPNVETRGRLAYTNNGVGGAFRGFGANQMSFAVECQLDRLASLCDLSPVEMRQRNLVRPRSPGYFGQALAPSDRFAEMLAAAASSPLWHLERGVVGDEEIIGVGMAMNHHGNGLGSLIPDAAAGRLRFAKDGRIEACFSFDEMGQGVLASIVSLVTAGLGCGREDIRPVIGDTASGPDSGSTTAARSTFVIWQTTQRAGPLLADKLCAAAGRILSRDPTDLRLSVGGIVARDSPPGDEPLIRYRHLAESLGELDLPSIDTQFDYPTCDYTLANARFLFASGACVARVAISRVTGQVRVLDLDQHTAAGPVVDMAAYLGQQEGGAIQGMGSSLSEDALMRDGVYLTPNLDSYLMPGVADVPERMRVYALEELDPHDCYGPRGVGELGIGAVTPAIANAVFEAIGRCPAMSPIAPEWVLDTLGAGR